MIIASPARPDGTEKTAPNIPSTPGRSEAFQNSLPDIYNSPAPDIS